MCIAYSMTGGFAAAGYEFALAFSEYAKPYRESPWACGPPPPFGKGGLRRCRATGSIEGDYHSLRPHNDRILSTSIL